MELRKSARERGISGGRLSLKRRLVAVTLFLYGQHLSNKRIGNGSLRGGGFSQAFATGRGHTLTSPHHVRAEIARVLSSEARRLLADQIHGDSIEAASRCEIGRAS